MFSPLPAGIADTDWSEFLASTSSPIIAQPQENPALRQVSDEVRVLLTGLAIELATLLERIGRSSRNSSTPPSSEVLRFELPERRKGSGRNRGGQLGHPGSGPEPW